MDPQAAALVSNIAPASTATTDYTMHPECRTESNFTRCLASARRLASKKKRTILKTHTKARCREIIKCVKAMPEPECRDEPGAWDAFKTQHAESVTILRRETGEEMPNKNNFYGVSVYTIDESDNPKLFYDGKEVVCEEDMYDVAARAFEQAVRANPRAKIGTLITKMKDMFGGKGTPEFQKYFLRAESFEYLNPTEPEPTAATTAAVQPETAIVPVPTVTSFNGAPTSVPGPTTAAAQPGTAVFSMEYRLNRDEERHRPVKQYRDALNASSTAAGVSRGPVGCLDLFWIRVAPSHFVRC